MTSIRKETVLGNAEFPETIDTPISLSRPDQDLDRDERADFVRRCAAIIPQMRTNGYGWGGFADFSPAAIDWLKSNQNVVRADKDYFQRQRPSKQRADAMWAMATR